jgi:sulfate transport system substrate-binding protein
MTTAAIRICLALAAGILACGCRDGDASASGGAADSLVVAGYTTPREAFAEIIPEFAAEWKARTGRDLSVAESYLGSGAQSRAVAGGFPADVVALSLEPDVDRIAKAGLLDPAWKSSPTGGTLTRSVVVFAVRTGNPKAVRGWEDLVRPGVRVMMGDPRMSGGAQWAVLAASGAVRRGKVPGYAPDDEGVTRYLGDLLGNVLVLDKGARESIISFEKGIGDVALTYENEALAARRRGRDYDYVIPESTVLIENPVALVDASLQAHGNRAAAEAFVRYLRSERAQRIFAEHGFRPVDPSAARAAAARFPVPADLFTVDGQFGGFGKAAPAHFGPDGLWTLAARRRFGA